MEKQLDFASWKHTRERCTKAKEVWNMKISHIVVVALALLAAGSFQAADRMSQVAGMEMDPAMQEAMKRGAPGAHHQALEPFVGRFTTSSRMWMKPGEPPLQSTGSAEHTWVLGGRFLQMDVRGDLGGQLFEGLGYLGYDNIRGEYTAVWLDNVSTGITRASGEFDPVTKRYSERGTFSCPMTGEKDRRFRGEWKVIDNDTLSYTKYNPGPDGKEVKGMEISYKREK